MFSSLNVRKCYLSGEGEGGNSTESDSRLEVQLVWKFLGISAFLADRAEIAAARLILRNICGWQRNRERMIFLRTYYYYLTVNSFLEIVFKVNLELIWLEVEKLEKAFERYVPYRWLRSAISTDSTFAFTYSFFFSPFRAVSFGRIYSYLLKHDFNGYRIMFPFYIRETCVFFFFYFYSILSFRFVRNCNFVAVKSMPYS